MRTEKEYQEVIESMLRCGENTLCEDCRRDAILLISPEEKIYEEIDLEIEEDLLLKLCLEAHRKDITLNKLICEIIAKYAEEEELGKYIYTCQKDIADDKTT